ncbi:MAG TPA: UDP-N-acetylmuramoyl-L-alanine--D-glutamate ligase [Candidatus Saccharimonadales bacterium]
MKIAILGFGLEGHAAYDYWRDGNEITICDQNEAVSVPDGVTSHLGTDYLADLDTFDLIVRSPFVHPQRIVEANSPDILSKVTSNVNEFFKVSPTQNIIGVTGTKGKGTTSTLIAKMLEAAGKRVHLGGNIGIPALELLKNDIQPDDWVVLELSSFQLIDIQYSPHIAVCLMVVAEHLDWHKDEAEYLTAKSRLFMHQKPSDITVYYVNNPASELLASRSSGHKIPYFAEPGATIENRSVVIESHAICKTDELKLIGEHNWQNVCAAATAVWQITQDVEALRSVLTSFSGLPFRIELRRTVNGIHYYNDSFATGPASSAAAITAIPGPKVMIIGGYERGLDLGELIQGIEKESVNIRKILLIGASKERVAEGLTKAGISNFVLSEANNMPAIVAEATDLAQSGDSVVLSPGFASFDMFKNFEERGKHFNEAVERL